MQILKEVYDSILDSVDGITVEVGGILGGTDGIITCHYFDKGIISEKPCTYTPNVSLLNEIIEKWSNESIDFLGIYHTHFNDVETLSCGDKTYIERIVLSMPAAIDHLCFPVVTLPTRGMVCYEAINEYGYVQIIKDELIVKS